MAGLSILMILSIINYINLATASAIKRAKEVVAKVLGEAKGISHFNLSQNTSNCSPSILFALVIVEISLPYYNELLDKV
jgi:putative ABC transport system permease protein